MVVAALVLSASGSALSEGKIRNVDVEVISAVAASLSGTPGGPGVGRHRADDEVFMLHPELHAGGRPTIFHIISKIERSTEITRIPGSKAQRLASLRKLPIEIANAPTTFRPPPVHRPSELAFGPRIFVGEIASRQVKSGTRPIPGAHGKYLGGWAFVSAPGYSPDGRFAGLSVTTMAFIHPVLSSYLLKKTASGWIVVAIGSDFVC